MFHNRDNRVSGGPKTADVVVIGFALFSMLFGAGNVIFPPYLGMQAGPDWLGAFTAYYIAAIGLALVAMYALLKMNGTHGVTDRLNKGASIALMIAIVMCIGPMLCIPRTAATTHEMTVMVLAPNVPVAVTSVVFFAIIYALCVKKSAIVDIIGKFLTPALLIGLLILIVMGVMHPINDIALIPQVDRVLVSAVDAGYQTMDTLGAMLFGTILLASISDKGYTEGPNRKKVFFGAATIAGVLLFIIYIGLVYLGATVSTMFEGSISRADLVIAIVDALMGRTGVIILGIVVALACVTTSVALCSASAEYFIELSGNKVSYPVMLAIVCAFSAAIATLGLDAIVEIASPILNIVYPPMLILVIISAFAPNTDNTISRFAVAGSVIVASLSVLNSFGIGGGALAVVDALPLTCVSMGWLIPSIIFGAVGYAVVKIRHHHHHADPMDYYAFPGK